MAQILLWSGIVALVLAIAGLALVHHGLLQRRLGCQEAWSQLTGVLKGRLALVDHLVQLAEDAAAGGGRVIGEVRAARDQAGAARGVEDRNGAEVRLTRALDELFALAGRYPGLASHVEFARLREELRSAENRIQFAAEQYNRQAVQYNRLRDKTPHRYVTRVLKLKRVETFPESAIRTPRA